MGNQRVLFTSFSKLLQKAGLLEDNTRDGKIMQKMNSWSRSKVSWKTVKFLWMIFHAIYRYLCYDPAFCCGKDKKGNVSYCNHVIANKQMPHSILLHCDWLKSAKT